MAASVNPVQRRQEKRDYGFDLLLKGIDIAAGAYGQKLNRDQQATLSQEANKRAEDARTTSAAIDQRDFDFKVKQEENRLAEAERDRQSKLLAEETRGRFDVQKEKAKAE